MRAFSLAVSMLWSVGPLTGCHTEPVRPPAKVILAVFDPTEGEIPMPTDILRDEEAGHLDLPTDTDGDALTPAEKELYGYLNTLEGWPKSSGATLTFSGRVAEASITDSTVQVWRFPASGPAVPYTDATLSLEQDGTSLKITPPGKGWPQGETIAIAVRGGDKGVTGTAGEVVECDAAFYYLRQRLPLNAHSDFRAFPGATRQEREHSARDLETLRIELAPYFDAMERHGLRREEIASLWTFTVHDHTQVLMDKESGEMPLPIDLLIDNKTGKVDLPIRETDSARDQQIKKDLRALDGFSLTACQLFEFSAPVDPKTVTSATVELYRVKDATKIPAKVELAQDDLRRVQVTPEQVPLSPRTTYALVLRQGIRDARGRPVKPMLIGHFVSAKEPLTLGGKKQIESLDDESADKLEWARQRAAPLLDALGRESVLLAWPFTTMSVVEPLVQAAQLPETLKIPSEPKDLVEKTPAKAVADFPIGALSLLRVKKVFVGKIATADYLDPTTRRPYADGSHKVRWIPFTLTIPNSADSNTPLPVVIFGHGLVCERRFVLAVADGLAKQGFAVISIDMPYHGTRSQCAWNGPICFPNPLSKTGDMLCPSTCQSGSTCGIDGQCRDENGSITPLATFPVVQMSQASGAAFIELDSIAGTMAHFRQAVIDLAALSRTLRRGTWKAHIGYTLDGDKLRYLGQSLGGIIGGTYVAVDPSIKRAVLNVPGGNLVPMFQESLYFGSHIDAFLTREKIETGTEDYARFLLIARWFMDAVDPINVAPYLMKRALPGTSGKNKRSVMIQMATLDFIIPNGSTEQLASIADVPRKDYVAEHAFLVVPVEPAYPSGTRDAAEFLAGSVQP